MKAVSKGRRLLVALLLSASFFSLTTLAAEAADGKIRGKVQYQKILFRNPDTGAPGLQFDRPVLRPVVAAKIELLDEAGAVLTTTTTDSAGNYQLSWSMPLPPRVKVRVLAAADNAVVIDYYDAEHTYSVSSDVWPLVEGETTKDIVATDKDRLSGPFNILAVIRIGNDLIRSAEPGAAFPHIKIRWTTRPREGTTYFVPAKNEAVILGDRDADSDEFDDFIILHEYGHFLAHTFSRDDSPGGYHSGKLRLDPRLAWSEGWANFFAAAALDDSNYIDTGVNRFDGSGVLLTMDLDEDRPNGDKSGYWSEHSVGSALWDLYDRHPGKLHVGLGFAEIWKTLRSKEWKDKPRYRNLIDFCDTLVAARPDLAERVSDVLAARNIKYTPDKDSSVPNPYIRPLKCDKAVEGEVDSTREAGHNRFEARAVFSLELKKKTKVKLHLEILNSPVKDKADLDLWLFAADGRVIRFSDASNGVGGTETIDVELEEGQYFVEVQSWAALRDGTVAYNTGSFRLKASYPCGGFQPAM